mgnify:CR=1 FL=1
MKLYLAPGAPSPLRVELMLKYKDVELDTEMVDLRNGAQMRPEFRQINPRCTVPTLILDDGTCLTEVIAITQFLDSLYPNPPAFGTTAQERAEVVNWMHKIFVDGFMAAAEALRNSSPAMKNRAMPGPVDIPQIPELAQRGLQRLRTFFSSLDQGLEGREYLVGNSLSQADIDAFVITDFAGWVKVKPTEEQKNLLAWKARVESKLG